MFTINVADKHKVLSDLMNIFGKLHQKGFSDEQILNICHTFFKSEVEDNIDFCLKINKLESCASCDKIDEPTLHFKINIDFINKILKIQKAVECVRELSSSIFTLDGEKVVLDSNTEILQGISSTEKTKPSLPEIKPEVNAEELKQLDSEMVQGSRGEKQGPLNGKLTRFIQRLESKLMDKRLNFIFNSDEELQKYEWFESLAEKLLDFGNEKGLKIIDFSEVPADILPLITGLIGRLIFSIQQWMSDDKRQPIALFCDEAHLYLPNKISEGIEERGLKSFERIAKEGRKYGVSLVVISQRPSDVNKTILSQCGNFIAMRLTNPEDQNVIQHLLPDNLGDFTNVLPILDVGEALIVGDSSLLPSRVIVNEPTVKPNSATIDFWTEWSRSKDLKGIKEAVESLRKQHK